MAYPRSLEMPSCFSATGEWRPEWDREPREALHARAEPRDRLRSAMRFAIAAGSGNAPPRAAPARSAPWAQPSSSAQGESNRVDASDFVLIVDDDPDLL